jgi:hypothetical protein
MPPIRKQARDWGLPVTLVVAVVIVHEQEHCVRLPDGRERPCVDAELRLARKLGNERLIERTRPYYDLLDERGYGKDA